MAACLGVGEPGLEVPAMSLTLGPSSGRLHTKVLPKTLDRGREEGIRRLLLVDQEVDSAESQSPVV